VVLESDGGCHGSLGGDRWRTGRGPVVFPRRWFPPRRARRAAI
jgi:hypothetical protein